MPCHTGLPGKEGLFLERDSYTFPLSITPPHLLSLPQDTPVFSCPHFPVPPKHQADELSTVATLAPMVGYNNKASAINKPPTPTLQKSLADNHGAKNVAVLKL